MYYFIIFEISESLSNHEGKVDNCLLGEWFFKSFHIIFKTKVCIMQVYMLNEQIMFLFLGWVIDEVIFGNENCKGWFNPNQNIFFMLESTPHLFHWVDSFSLQNDGFFSDVFALTANSCLCFGDRMRTNWIVYNFCEINISKASSCNFF